MEVNKLVSAIVIFVIALVVVFLFVMPKYQKFNDLQIILAQKQAEYNGESAYYAKLSELIKNIDERKDISEKIDSALPSHFSMAPLIYFFQKKATATGLVVKSLVFSPGSGVVPGQKMRSIAFTVDMSGSYEGLRDFLAVLDKSARIFEVNSISFVSAENFQTLPSLPISIRP